MASKKNARKADQPETKIADLAPGAEVENVVGGRAMVESVEAVHTSLANPAVAMAAAPSINVAALEKQLSTLPSVKRPS